MQWQAQQDAQRRAEDEAKRVAEEQRKRDTFNTAITAALGAQRGTAAQTLNQRGLSQDEFMPLIENELTRVRTTIPDLDSNPGSYFSPSLVDSVLAGEQTARRSNYTRDINNLFPSGYEYNTFSDTADDSVLGDILSGAYGRASDSLLRARQRGNLDETGYNYALGQLGTQKSAANATLQQRGGDVLNRYRGDITNLANTARTAAGNYELGQSFDTGAFGRQRDDLIGSRRSTLEGDVRATAGTGDDLFNIDSLINSAGSIQGATNSAGNLAGVLEARQKKRSATRGLGSQGEF